MSMSLTLSACRRAEPASCMCACRGPRSRQAATSASPISIAAAAGARAGPRARAGVRRRAPPARSPRASGRGPRTVRRRCASAASRSFASESMPSSECSSRARLGPRPGRRVIAIRPAGNFARSFSAAGIVPVSRARGSSPAACCRSRAARSPAGARERGDRHGRLAHGLRGGPVGEHAVHDRAVELVQVAQFLQGVGDRGVGRVGHGTLSVGPAGAPRVAAGTSRRGTL
jgi:hypothetical protein